MMKISLIAAMTPGNHVIGGHNQMLWKLPNDFKHFKDLTMGKPIIMGRKTHESIGKALPGRDNIVITRQEGYLSDGCVIVHSLRAALTLAQWSENPEAMIIGGGEIYSVAMPVASTIYATFIHGHYDGDAFFPPIGSDWVVGDREFHEADDKHDIPYSFVTFIRRTNDYLRATLED